MLHKKTYLSLRLKLLCSGVFAVVCLCLLSLLPPLEPPKSVNETKVQTNIGQNKQKNSLFTTDSNNAVSSGIASMEVDIQQNFKSAADNIGYTAHIIGYTIYDGLREAGFVAVHGVSVAANFVGSVVSFAAHSVIDGVVVSFSTIGKVIGSFTNTPVVSAMIKPSDGINPPVIDASPTPLSIEDYAYEPDESGDPVKIQTSTHQHQENGGWPLHGDITAHFGVPHWPYQPVHTGLDISSGAASGVTPIVPIKNGVVAETVSSYYGLGNHVTVDHGNGLSSVYAHLSKISVEEGEEVNTTTIIGYEGSTGMSTGPHLHLEVRINDKTVDPLQYID